MNDLRSGQEYFDEARIALGYNNRLEKMPEKPAYFVSMYGDPNRYGPFYSAIEARECFASTYPTFDGASVTVIKVAPTIPNVTPSELLRNVAEEEYDPTVNRENETWVGIYDRSTTVMARAVWNVTQDQAGMNYRRAENEYKPEFLAEVNKEVDAETERQIETMRDELECNRDPRRIESIHESEWHQGFGSEYKEHLGKDKDGKYYYATEHSESPEDDLCWEGPFKTKKEAEQGLSKEYKRWDKRTGEREQAWEDQQIARVEKELERDIQIMQQASATTLPFRDPGSAIHTYLNNGGTDRGLAPMEKMYAQCNGEREQAREDQQIAQFSAQQQREGMRQGICL